MTTTRVILISAATAVVLLSILVALGWGFAHNRHGAGYSGLMQAHHMRGRLFAGSSGMRHGGCERLTDEHIDTHLTRVDDWVASELDLNDEQHAALAPVLDVGSAWVGGLRELCDAQSDSAPESLSLLSGVTGSSDAAVKQLVTSFAGFYATLDDEQRGRLDQWMQWPHRRGGVH